MVKNKFVQKWSAGATSTTTVLTLNNFAFFQFRLGDSTNAVRSEVGVSSLNASQATQIFVSLFLPFRNKVCISDLLFDAVIIQLLKN